MYCKSPFLFLLLLLATTFGQSQLNPIYAQGSIIKNDVFWNTTDGRPIYSQGGGIFRFADPATGEEKYYWYGVHYKEAEAYRSDPSITHPRTNFVAVTCYTSNDLVAWKFENNVLTKEELDAHGRTFWLGRLGVTYLPELKKYAMLVQHNSVVLITVSDSPVGPFTWHQEINMKEMIGTTNTGDQTVFTDEDSGKSYLVYSYGQGRNKIYISEIGVKDGKVALLDCTKIFQGAGREGNCMFKYKGKYYMFASNLYGWDASLAYYLVAENIRGPYLPENNMQVLPGAADDYAHVTQTGFFVNVKGTKKETVVYCGDRWANFAGNGLGYNQWVPLSFDGATPYFNSLSAWKLNAKTGEWSVAAGNNYVKNGSFEADRKAIPSPVKPVQEQLTGWTAVVLEGNKISQDSSVTPVLNFNNSESDRKVVIGEKSLSLSDRVPFERKVFQIITSTPYVKLENGNYTLTAKMKNSSGFTNLQMYATTGGKTFNHRMEAENSAWRTIKIENIKISGGKVEIGFIANGAANSFCYVDDVILVKAQ
jgi:hypothetical protein